MHLDDDRLQRLLHGEASSSEEKRGLEHLTQCGPCRSRFDELEREEGEVGSLLRTLDHPVPPVDAGLISRRAAARHPWMPRWAAGVALALGLAGAAYALPGSPLPHWVEAVVDWAGGHRRPAAIGSESDGSAAPSFAGIAVSPGQNLLILFRAADAGGTMSVTLTGGAAVQVRAPRGAATFSSEEGRLIVDDQGGAADYEIEIPQAAPRVEIRVNERVVFVKEGPRVSAPGFPGTRATYRVPLVPSGS